MGDIVSLVEKAQEQVSEEEAQALQDKMASGKMTMDDFLKQLKRIRKMGSMQSLLGMMPGIGKALKDLPIEEKQIDRTEAIIQSMTLEERTNPNVINGSRRQRIARGAGVEVQDVNQLLKQFREMKKMMKTMSKMASQGRSADLGNMLGQLGGR